MNALFGLNKWVGRQIRGADDSDMAEYENRSTRRGSMSAG